MVSKEITLLTLLYPTPRVGTSTDLPCESSIGLTLKVRINPSNIDPLSVIVETHTPKIDSLIEGLRLDEIDENRNPTISSIESHLKSSISKLIAQCREISAQLTKYANNLEHASKKEITGIDEKLQQAIKESKNSSQHVNSVVPRDVNQNHRTQKSSISPMSSLTPDLSLFE
jgi:hypothetical protein